MPWRQQIPSIQACLGVNLSRAESGGLGGSVPLALGLKEEGKGRPAKMPLSRLRTKADKPKIRKQTRTPPQDAQLTLNFR